MLRVNGVALLCDIRSYPSSKRCPQWNQAEIIAAIPSDISYARVRARTRRVVQLAEKLTVAIACTEAVFLAFGASVSASWTSRSLRPSRPSHPAGS